MNEQEISLLEILKKETLSSLTKRGRKKELIDFCKILGLDEKGNTNDLAFRLRKWYDSKTYKERLEKWNLKLEIDMKPSLFHGATIRKNIGTLWNKKIRPEILQKYDYTCTICDYKVNEVDAKHLHVHELEAYDYLNIVCDLKGLDLICVNCHSFHHWGRTVSVCTKEQIENLKLHFAQVNNIPIDMFDEYYRLRYLQLEVRNEKTVVPFINNTPLNKFNFSPPPVVKFKISGDIPHKKEAIEKLRKKDLYFEE